jgi:hypothetical protein
VHEPHVTGHRNIPGREMITETLLTVPLEGAKVNSEIDQIVIDGIGGGAQTSCDHVVEDI